MAILDSVRSCPREFAILVDDFSKQFNLLVRQRRFAIRAKEDASIGAAEFGCTTAFRLSILGPDDPEGLRLHSVDDAFRPLAAERSESGEKPLAILFDDLPRVNIRASQRLLDDLAATLKWELLRIFGPIFWLRRFLRLVVDGLQPPKHM